jgi:hypothetical protein
MVWEGLGAPGGGECAASAFAPYLKSLNSNCNWSHFNFEIAFDVGAWDNGPREFYRRAV